jgi:hypothetical protein
LIIQLFLVFLSGDLVADRCPPCLVCAPGNYILSGEREEKALFESGAGASLRRLLCLNAWGLYLSGERGRNAVFESGAVARVHRLLCLRACGQRLSVEQGGNAVFECLGVMPSHEAGEKCDV